VTSGGPIVVVGGGAAGVAAAETLRQEGYGGSLVLLGVEGAGPVPAVPEAPARFGALITRR